MPCVRNHIKARRSSLEKARDAKKEKALVNNHIVVETDQRLSTTTVVAEDKNDDDQETDYEDATLSTEFELKLLMSNITTLVLNFMGIDVADSSPDNVRLITSTLRPEGTDRPLIYIVHDETTLYANDASKIIWMDSEESE